jgi:hypothetical protein
MMEAFYIRESEPHTDINPEDGNCSVRRSVGESSTFYTAYPRINCSTRAAGGDFLKKSTGHTNLPYHVLRQFVT